jgi:hypothetical protein
MDQYGKRADKLKPHNSVLATNNYYNTTHYRIVPVMMNYWRAVEISIAAVHHKQKTNTEKSHIRHKFRLAAVKDGVAAYNADNSSNYDLGVD